MLDIRIGTVLDEKYKILCEVGRGGMSRVYLALNEKANKYWAVKEVRISKDENDMSYMERNQFEKIKKSFIREKDILCKLHHKYLPSIVDVIEDKDCILIIMDYIEGRSLLNEIEEYGVQDQSDVIKWAIELCDVLSYLHSREPPVIHRDIKPSNIMLRPDGDITVIDFGTAREYKDMDIMDTMPYATYAYAAPEQINDKKTDARTDIYSLGATMYHLLTGKHPDIMKYSPVRLLNPHVSQGLDEIIRMCMQHNPEDRYFSVDELRYALENYERYTPVYRKKQKQKLIIFIMIMFCTLISGVVSVWGYISADNKKNSEYERILIRADSCDDYYSAILTDSVRIDAYEKMLFYFTEDNILTSAEADMLYRLQLGIDVQDKRHTDIRYVLEELKQKDIDSYMFLCNEIGTAFIYYYDSDNLKDCYANAAVWFEEASEKYKSAAIYCSISKCLQLINSFSESNQEHISGIYEQYIKLWDMILCLENEIETYSDTDSKLGAWMEIGKMINASLFELSTVIDKEDVCDLIYDIKNGIDSESNDITSQYCIRCDKVMDMILEKLKEDV